MPAKTDYEDLSVEELEALQQEVNEEISVLHEKARAVKEVRNRKTAKMNEENFAKAEAEREELIALGRKARGDNVTVTPETGRAKVKGN